MNIIKATKAARDIRLPTDSRHFPKSKGFHHIQRTRSNGDLVMISIPAEDLHFVPTALSKPWIVFAEDLLADDWEVCVPVVRRGA